MTWTHLSDTTPRARKRYQCILCDEHIEVKQPHVARRGIGDDGYITSRMHILCESISRKWKWWEWEDHRDPGEFKRWEIDEKGITDLNTPIADQQA